MAWEKVASPQQQQQTFGDRTPIQKWQRVGQEVEGIFRGYRKGKYGPLLVVERGGVETVCATTSVLVDRLSGMREGDLVRIVYLGKVMGNGGREYHTFDVWRDVAPVQGGSLEQHEQLSKQLEASIEFERLVKLIEKEKGAQVASVIASVAKAAGEPVKSLRAAMEQMGVVPF